MKKLTKLQAIASVPLFIITAYFIISNILFINKCELVKATITNSVFTKMHYDEDNGRYSVTLQIPNGKIINGLSFEGDKADTRFAAGQVVELYYDSAQPEKSEIKNVWTQWGASILFSFLLLYDLVSLGVLYVTYFRKEKDVIATPSARGKQSHK
jgi:hypothetical protein